MTTKGTSSSSRAAGQTIFPKAIPSKVEGILLLSFIRDDARLTYVRVCCNATRSSPFDMASTDTNPPSPHAGDIEHGADDFQEICGPVMKITSSTLKRGDESSSGASGSPAPNGQGAPSYSRGSSASSLPPAPPTLTLPPTPQCQPRQRYTPPVLPSESDPSNSTFPRDGGYSHIAEGPATSHGHTGTPPHLPSL